MNLCDIANTIDKEESLHIQYWDENMSITREIDPYDLSRFLKSNGHLEVKQLIPGNYKLNVIISKPY